MADELEPVEQKFVADMDEYLGELEAGVEEARAFADANAEASGAIDGMRDHAAETGAALDDLAAQTEAAKEADDGLRDSAAEAAAALDAERDKALEAAAAAGIYADKVGNLHEANGRFLSGARAAELGIEDFKDDLVKAKNGVEDLDTETRSFASRITSTFGGGGLLGKLLGGAEGAGGDGGLTGLVDKIPTSLVAIIPAAFAALTEVTGLVAGFAAAGAGAAAFGVLAMPAFKAVTTAYTQINTDQKAYDDALTKTARNTALKKLKQDYADLDPAERGAVRGIQHLMDTYHRMAKAFEGPAFKVFNDGLELANELLPDVTPFAQTFATTVDGLLKKADKFAGSKGFKDWLDQFHKLEGPSITAIGDGIGKVATSVGKLLTTMSAKDVVHAINIAFDALAGTISAVSYVVKRLMGDWDTYSSAFRRVRHDMATGGHEIAADFDSMRHTIADWAHNTSAYFDEVRHDVATFAHDTAAHFDEVRHDVATWGHDVASDFDTVRHTIASWGHDLANDFDTARHDVAQWADDVRSDTDKVVSWFGSLPGKVEGKLKGLAGDLERAGENAIDGFLHGIESAAGGVLSAVEHLASEVSGIFAKVLSMASPSRVFYQHGVNTLQGYINGIEAAAPAVHAALARVGGQVAAGGVGATGSAAPSVHVTVPLTLGVGTQGYNDPRFLQYIQQVVQEATLRFTQVNPSNGFNLPGKLS